LTAPELGEGGTPIYLAGRFAANVRDGEDARLLMKSKMARAYRLAPETDFQIVSEQRDSRSLSYTSWPTHAGITVAGAEVVVQVDREGAVMAIIGQLAPEWRAPAQGPMDGDAALRALQGLGAVSAPAP